ncbi:CapA family protein [Paraburkholderia diazotrophica]|uniref:Poly-gamma-glutamate synthesis protein (Capsule biosynthesis protein) n=1 Tax=Paraburkholderia diazotrophica TaxID=667676 RepID=A0A1H7C730_9BURK|nr:CapA family protein [Paraburkholderia diazotrophica]SEJ85438.1 poly-gamma-glutamate synthesis protein (capsule biosynthesis protein) [Paraburkholderia diazotrophica]
MNCITLFLCGDVMLGRGIDQILKHPNRPRLFEPYVRSAKDYVSLAEANDGPLPERVPFDYVWGDALRELDRMNPDARIINLETAVTSSEDAWPRKGIHYRMHPANAPVLSAAKIDCCSLANNHVLDWGCRGLTETLDTLRVAGIHTAGAGQDDVEAAAPAVIGLAGRGRVVVFALATQCSGVGKDWAAGRGRPGVSRLADFSAESVRAIAKQVRRIKQPADVVVVSIHWGENFDFDIPASHRRFAHDLVDSAAVDLVHGHSSHHVKGIEVYQDKLILYGAGDFINDYEGISGQEAYRGDLSLMYFPVIELATGKLVELSMTPMQIRRFRVNRAPEEGIRWLEETLNRESRPLGAAVERRADDTLVLRAFA